MQLPDLIVWFVVVIACMIALTCVAAVVLSLFPKKETDGEVIIALRGLVSKFILWVQEGISWKTLVLVGGPLLIMYFPGLEPMYKAIVAILGWGTFGVLKQKQNAVIIETKAAKDMQWQKLMVEQSSRNTPAKDVKILPTSTGGVTGPSELKPNVTYKPTPDTSVPFNDDDRAEMPQPLQDIVIEWFGRSVTHRPTMPDIPPVEGVLPYQWEKANQQRAEEADRVLEEEGYYKVFPIKDLDAAYKFRKNCSLKVWNRVNFLWRLAFQRWMEYGMALWKFEDSKVNKPPEPRPQPDW